MATITRRQMSIVAIALATVGVAWWLFFSTPPGPTIRILGVNVTPSERNTNGGTRLHVTTRYENTGCTRILLARFLMNTMPTPTFVLPQQVGPHVLPITAEEVIEDVDLNFKLATGEWHLFTNVVCYNDGDPVPTAVVSPTALFDQT